MVFIKISNVSLEKYNSLILDIVQTQQYDWDQQFSSCVGTGRVAENEKDQKSLDNGLADVLSSKEVCHADYQAAGIAIDYQYCAHHQKKRIEHSQISDNKIVQNGCPLNETEGNAFMNKELQVEKVVYHVKNIGSVRP